MWLASESTLSYFLKKQQKKNTAVTECDLIPPPAL